LCRENRSDGVGADPIGVDQPIDCGRKIYCARGAVRRGAIAYLACDIVQTEGILP